MTKGNVRRDPVTKSWIIFAPEKVNTILERNKEIDKNSSVEKDSCAFCPGQEFATGHELFRYSKVLPTDPEWTLRAFPARNPIMKIEEELKFQGDGVYDLMGRFGAHEVIVETAKHIVYIDELSEKEIQDIFWSYHDRIVDLKRDRRFKYLMAYKNRGKTAGAKMEHHYSELVAFPFVPPVIESEIANASSYYNFKQRCVFCDAINQEIQQRVRIVEENDEFIAFCPFASRFPFEVMIMPKKHTPYFEDSTKYVFMQLARIYKNVMLRIRKALDAPAYNVVIHNTPVNNDEEFEGVTDYYHWHMEITPRLTSINSLAMSGGVFVNPTFPEDAASYLQSIPV